MNFFFYMDQDLVNLGLLVANLYLEINWIMISVLLVLPFNPILLGYLSSIYHRNQLSYIESDCLSVEIDKCHFFLLFQFIIFSLLNVPKVTPPVNLS